MSHRVRMMRMLKKALIRVHSTISVSEVTTNKSSLDLRTDITTFGRLEKAWQQVRRQASSFQPLPWGRRNKISFHLSSNQQYACKQVALL